MGRSSSLYWMNWILSRCWNSEAISLHLCLGSCMCVSVCVHLCRQVPLQLSRLSFLWWPWELNPHGRHEPLTTSLAKWFCVNFMADPHDTSPGTCLTHRVINGPLVGGSATNKGKKKKLLLLFKIHSVRMVWEYGTPFITSLYYKQPVQKEIPG